MLRSLHVKNFAIIDESLIEFGNHLNILTGETGAGKSILIGSVNAALGQKVSKDMIRHGAEYALIELTFDELSDEIVSKLKDMDIYPDDGEIVLSRKITDAGKSTCRINGETVNTNDLKAAAELLIDIHGQQEHQSLIRISEHRKLLDKFAAKELGELPEIMAAAYKEYTTAKEELSENSMDEAARLRESEYLRFAADEIEAANLKRGEDEEMEAEYKILSNAQQIAENLSAALRETRDDETGNAESLMMEAGRYISRISAYDERLEKLLETINTAADMISDFNRQADDYVSEMEDSRERFAKTEERLDVLNSLKNKYGGTIEAVLEYKDEALKKLEVYENYDLHIEMLKKKLREAEEKCKKTAGEISKIRHKKAEELNSLMIKALLDLNFVSVDFSAEVTELEEFTSLGIDKVEFMVSLNPGEPVKPLAKIASGGEQSRIMLAIKSALADKDEIPTLIFDEIDTGISGRTAQKVSAKLGLLAGTHQLICITHLAQIAAMADTHFVIEKTSDSEKTYTRVKSLDEDGQIEELARILGGAEITPAVYDNAREMKKLADKQKNR